MFNSICHRRRSETFRFMEIAFEPKNLNVFFLVKINAMKILNGVGETVV